MITLRNIEKYFEHGPTKTFVLRRINADIKEGEFVSIMGPSGAGKSTLLHLIGMHDSAWTGEYTFLATRSTRSTLASFFRATICSTR
jgi:putative ABC transport system ATP-binding protein